MNKWRNDLRRRARAPLANAAELSGLVGDDALDAYWDDEHRRHLVRRALELMQADFEPRTWKACWELVVAGRPGADVAAELGMTENAAYIAKWRVLRRLREELAGLLD
jgi:RNA polymerase sigma-70 factor (ECF subfamily)